MHFGVCRFYLVSIAPCERNEKQAYLEFGHSDEVIHAYFDEIENLPIVHPHERESIRPFLRTLRNDEQRCVVFLGPEFKGGGIFEGANGVLFGERDCVGSFERHLRGLTGLIWLGNVMRRRRTRSFIAGPARSPTCVPLTKIHVRASSISFGSRASIARFERAFLGFLGVKTSPLY